MGSSEKLLKVLFGERINVNTVLDKKNITVAITPTTSRFGPSGSSKKKNIVLEHKTAVMTKISNEIFFDLKYIFLKTLYTSGFSNSPKMLIRSSGKVTISTVPSFKIFHSSRGRSTYSSTPLPSGSLKYTASLTP